MFQRHDFSFARAGDAAAPAPVGFQPGFGRRPSDAARRGWQDLDLVVDLGARIGSRDWWRGLATLVACLALAYLLSPSIGRLTVVAPPAYDDAQWDEARAQGIAPIAEGADTGRRMAPNDLVQPLAETPERPRVDIAAPLGMGDGFGRFLTRAGVDDAEAAHVAEMVGEAVPLDELKAGTRIELTLGRRAHRDEARPLDHLLFRARFDLRLAVERVNGRLQLQRLPIAVDDTPLRIEGRAGTSLYLAARGAGAPSAAVADYLRALSTRVSLSRDIDADDRFDLIVAQRRAATGEVETGDLLYGGLTHGGRTLQLMKWAVGGKPQWFEPAGVGEERGGMRMPVAGAHLTSTFGFRFHPVLGFSRMHKGVDFGAPTGTPIVAATEGTVVYAGWHGGHGNFVQLKQSNAFGTGYAHMSRIIARVGEHVAAGELIGYVGSTGLSTGPHLHFETYVDGQAVNPLTVNFRQAPQIAGAELVAFRARLAQLLHVPVGASRPKLEAAAAPAKGGAKKG